MQTLTRPASRAGLTLATLTAPAALIAPIALIVLTAFALPACAPPGLRAPEPARPDAPIAAPAAPPAISSVASPDAPRRPVSTYSIVARDAATGELGVAVQSHWFSVGPIVPWAQAGVGAVATQSFVHVGYGPEGLASMAAGSAPADALAALLARDEGREVRQVAMVDASGRVAAHTGARCIAAAGHAAGDGYSVQANLMEQDTVWPAMAAAFEAAQGPLAERMLAALHAAEGEGGDIRGRQSAAIVVVRGEAKGTAAGKPWEDTVVELRVEDHPDPLAELSRLLRLSRAYAEMNAGDAAFETGDLPGAMARYRAALELAPEVHEIAFWSGVTLAGADRIDEALPLLARAYRGEPRFRELLGRLPAAGLLPDDAELIARLRAAE